MRQIALLELRAQYPDLLLQHLDLSATISANSDRVRAHRPAVTLAVGMLHKAGLIAYSRGKITITDRLGLESASCGCYQAVRDEYDLLLGAEAVTA
ncbi:MAG: hypothetical protein ABI889_10395 [Gemmatimonadota bacterium]